MKNLLTTLFIIQCIFFLSNQSFSQVTETKNIRLYEHHSTIPGDSYLGTKSGIDLVTLEQVAIWDSNINPLPANERINIDMHEAFSIEIDEAGFTSAIDNDNYGGNDQTLFSKMPTNFNYDELNSISEIESAYEPSNASKTASNVAIGDVFIAKLRNGNEYVAIQITAIQVGVPLTDPNVQNFFEFSVKKEPIIIEKRAIRLYDHHSTIANVGFLGGDMSGYDLIKGEHVAIFDDGTNITAISAERRQSIDMSELFFFDQNLGQFSMGGFTSDIDERSIGGNSTTTFSPADNAFDYDGITSLDEIKEAYQAENASKSFPNVSVNDIYIAKLRGLEQYAAIKITQVHIVPANPQNEEYFIEFSYKSASNGTESEEDNNEDNDQGSVVTSANFLDSENDDFRLYPNPVQSIVNLDGISPGENLVTIRSLNGKNLYNELIIENQIDLSNYENGIYILTIQTDDQRLITKRLIKQ